MSNPTYDFATALVRLGTFVDICERSLRMATQETKLEDAFSVIRRYWPSEGAEDHPPECEDRQRKHAEVIEAFASEQHKDGYPYLYGLATVRLWTLLETCVDALVVGALRTPEACPRVDILRGLKGPLIEYMQMSADERAEYLAQQLELAVNAGRKPGLGQFEAVLEPVGLSGPVEPIVSRILLEAQQVRHVFVHRDGYVDAKLRAACPWIVVPVGSPLHLRRDHFATYAKAAFCYAAIELQRRARKHTPESMLEAVSGIRNAFVADLSRVVPTLW